MGKERSLFQYIREVVLSSSSLTKSMRREGGRQGERERLRGNGYYNLMSYIPACFPTFFLLTNTTVYLQSILQALCTAIRNSRFTQTERLLYSCAICRIALYKYLILSFHAAFKTIPISNHRKSTKKLKTPSSGTIST